MKKRTNKEYEIAVPIMFNTYNELESTIDQFTKQDYDIIEWRVDYFNDITDFKQLKKSALLLKEKLNDKSLLFTIRTIKDNGLFKYNVDTYQKILEFIIENKLADIIDIEYLFGHDILFKICDKAKENNITTFISYHNFHEMLSKDKLIELFLQMQSYDTNLVKIALMPTNEYDILTYLDSCLDVKNKYSNQPYTIILMGEIGKLSRYELKLTGNSLTFASLKDSSAPGQLNLEQLNNMLKNSCK